MYHMYKENRLDINKISASDNPLIQECNDMCSCHIDFCPNRVVQHGLQKRLEVTDFRTLIIFTIFDAKIQNPRLVFRTENKGWGLRSRQTIESGEFVTELVGEIVQSKDFNFAVRIGSNNSSKCKLKIIDLTYVFELIRLFQMHFISKWSPIQMSVVL